MMGEAGEVVFDLERALGEIAAACRLAGGEGAIGRAAPGRGKHDPLHRAVPQGADRRAGRGGPAGHRGRDRATSASWPIARTRSSRRSTSRASSTTRSARRSSPAATRRSSKRLYLPYKPKRRTRATIARQRGLEPLAVLLKRQVNPGGSPRGGAAAVHQSRPGRARRRGGPARRLRHRGRGVGRRRRRSAAWCARR